jgi:hypothetical protein
MNLTEAISRLSELDIDAALCVMRPWVPSSECLVVELDEALSVPASVRAAGLDYFMEIHVAREVLGVLEGRAASLDEKVRLLIFYAQNDAYPDWVYSDSSD